ncbi:MAG TPA: hypothetical protein PLL93_16545, partial [bacterium]|nr:hypothetical protein [bacterium]
MKLTHIYFSAWHATWNNRRMAIMLWFTTLITAIPGYVMAYRTMGQYFGRTEVPSLWKNGFELNYLFDLMIDQPSAGTIISSVFGGAAIVSLILMIFLTGGIVAALIHPNEQNHFWHNCGKYFGRFFRLFLWNAVFVMIGIALIPTYEYGWIITVILSGTAIMAGDIAKIRIVYNAHYSVTRMYFQSWKWVWQHVHHISALYIVNGIAFVAVFALYKYLDNGFVANNGLKLLMMIVLHQLFVYFRAMMRIQFLAAPVALWKNLHYTVVPPRVVSSQENVLQTA